jgi:hypothetical protein
MKINPQTFQFLSLRSLILAVAIGAILATQSVFAGIAVIPHSIVLTENSRISLSATYDGSAVAVLNPNPDQWIVTFPATVSFVGGTFEWEEPENPNLANIVMFAQGGFTLSVFSDLGDHANGFVPLANGSTINGVGFDSINGAPISATFTDGAATAEVPETGSTFALLFLSLTALLGANRLGLYRFA